MNNKADGKMKNEELISTRRAQQNRFFILHSSFFIFTP
jgi:hypothetical protein